MVYPQVVPRQLLRSMKDTFISAATAARATVAYADVFDYPLTVEELSLWKLRRIVIDRNAEGVEQKNGYFFLRGRSALVLQRQTRAVWQEHKWSIAHRAARWLSLIPTIQLVGVTGGLAMNNARAEDDIDLFLVAAPSTIWISRLLSIVFMQLLGLRRRPGEKDVVNKVCLNMFMSPRSTKLPFWGLDIPVGDRDCFSAHEVLQMRPLWEQPGVYRKFLYSNQWTRAYLPAAWNEKLKYIVPAAHRTPLVVEYLFRICEYPAKKVQLWYMRNRRTKETITDTMLRFHPKDARVWVKRKFASRLARFGIPLDKIFYSS